MTEEKEARILEALDRALETEDNQFFLAVEVGRLLKERSQSATSSEINRVIGDVLRGARGIVRRAPDPVGAVDTFLA